MLWIFASAFTVLGALILCEYLGDYVVLQHCKWPKIESTKYTESPLRALILADPHILSPHSGQNLKKLYFEGHMTRAFQSSASWLQPDVVFVLGDLFHQGHRVSEKQFNKNVLQYRKMFHLPPGIPLISVPGNHDVGFHYKMHSQLMARFEKSFNYTLVHLYTLKNIHFVLINSMALEADGCIFCTEAESNLKNISWTLKCMKYPQEAICTHAQPYSQPILIQHIPTYRSSDKDCLEHDAPYMEAFRERLHVMSRDATDMLGELLKPRLIFAGHSHQYCHSKNRLDIDEYTVASYNWRNKNNPSFMLATFTRDNYAVAKCQMLSQQFVEISYLCAGVLCLIFIVLHVRQWNRKNTSGVEGDDRKDI